MFGVKVDASNPQAGQRKSHAWRNLRKDALQTGQDCSIKNGEGDMERTARDKNSVQVHLAEQWCYPS
jgi:hypothetical protein